mgnify:CR=1 FL=1
MALLAVAILCAMDAVLKDLTMRYSSMQVTLMRFAPSAMFGALFFFLWRTPRPSRRSVIGNMQRGVLFLIASALFIHAISTAPLAQVFAVSYIAPVLAALLAMAILGERPDGAAAALASAISYAFVLVYLRRQALSDPPITIALFQSLMPALILGGLFAAATVAAPQSSLAQAWIPIPLSDVPPLIFIGLCSIIGHMAMAHAYARAEASRLAPTEYSSFVWAVLIGFFLFAETPSLTTFIGAAMIIGACFLIRR